MCEESKSPEAEASRLFIPALLVLALLVSPFARLDAADTPEPASVTLAGDLQQELGCPGDWLPDCASTHLTFDAEDAVWQGTFPVPAGSWQYKAPVNDSWTENYGAGGQRDGANIGLDLASPTDVKFYYSHQTHWITDDVGSIIATAPGSFQSELGCSGDWQPWCLRSWLQDPDGDGTFVFRTSKLPAGAYEVKVAHGESWDENYGAGGVQNGPNVPFAVPADCADMRFEYELASHVLVVSEDSAAPQPGNVTIAGSFQDELGCPGDWQADCAVTHLAYDAEDDAWQGSFDLPAGGFEYKAAIDDSWDENYGANAQPNGANIPLALAEPARVKVYYSDRTHWVTSDRNARIATAAGSFQSELGCADDWQPWCLKSWLQDADGDGVYVFSTSKLPAGNYEVKVAIDESWDENYGAGGVQNGPNIAFTVPASCTEIFFVFDSATNTLTVGTDGGPRGNLALAQAHWVDGDTIAWRVGTVPADATYTLHHAAAGGLGLASEGVTGADDGFALSRDPAGLSAAQLAKFPHLAGFAAFKLGAADLARVPEILKGQLAVSVAAGGGLVDATSLQIPGVLDALYTWDGPLGPTFTAGTPTLSLWAPTAKSVALHLFDDSDPATTATTIAMHEDPATGVWSVAGEAGWKGKYYLYEVEVWAPSTAQVETNLVTDPYSLSLAANSARSQIVDLADPALAPPGWSSLEKPPLAAPEDVVLYELHVRDFSWNDPSVPAAMRGTFRAFAQTGSLGMRHLRGLARAGLTHVHLLPSFDVATIPERRAEQQTPAGDLSLFAPDSEEQQAAVAAVENQDGFNWGYDPFHYTVPEGSYATDPDGPARIREFRQMVQALNQAGLRVVMDVVYNHTNSAGQNDKSVLDKIVPGYYHRLSLDGAIETSSCCPNTASEHGMMERLMVDSLATWVRHYKVDGFRFDLMGHHSKANLLAVRARLDALTTAHDGVDGSKVYLYGEGWNFGEVANNARFEQATQANMAGTGIGTFNDRIRDGVRGGGPFSGLEEQGFATGLFYDPNGTNQGSPADQDARLRLLADWIRVSLAGNLGGYTLVDRFGNEVLGSQIDYNGQQAGYTADPQEIIQYVEAHDNETFFDALQLKVPLATSLADRVRVQNLGLSLVGLAQGVPFFHAGQDLLRSKSLDRDSYNSGDWFNKLDFSYTSNNWGVGLPVASKNQSNWPLFRPLLANPDLAPGPTEIAAAAAHFRELLAIRKSSRLFRLPTAAAIEQHLGFLNVGPGQVPGLIVMALSDLAGDFDRKRELLTVLWNATDEAQSFTVPELAGARLRLHPVQRASADPVVAGSSYTAAAGTFTVPARTTAVFELPRPLGEQIDLLIADVRALVAGGDLTRAQALLLETHLELAKRQLERGNERAAKLLLVAFERTVELYVRRGLLDDTTGDELLGHARSLIEELG